jgi:hypothetical protein
MTIDRTHWDSMVMPYLALIGKMGDSLQTYIFYVGFEVLTAMVVKSTMFWDIAPCSPLSVNRRFGGTHRLHLQGRKNQFSKKPA